MNFLKSLFQPVDDVTDEEIFANLDDDFTGIILVMDDGYLYIVDTLDSDDRENLVNDVTYAMDTNTTISLETNHGAREYSEIVRGGRIVRALVV